jgi:hypothetical protein
MRKTTPQVPNLISKTIFFCQEKNKPVYVICKEKNILFIFQSLIPIKNQNPIESRHNAFDAYCLFRTDIFALAATETNLFVDYFEQTIVKF